MAENFLPVSATPQVSILWSHAGKMPLSDKRNCSVHTYMYTYMLLGNWTIWHLHFLHPSQYCVIVYMMV